MFIFTEAHDPYSVFHNYQVHRIFSLLPLTCSLLPLTCSLFPVP
ncbi:hypothetical protein [Moorena sp. SIO3I6]|nr:hypothetical protein [Moorena sp. SIO3I6]